MRVGIQIDHGEELQQERHIQNPTTWRPSPKKGQFNDQNLMTWKARCKMRRSLHHL